MRLTNPPLTCPNSAAKLLLCSETCCSDSTEGWVSERCEASMVLVISWPSTNVLKVLSGAPLTCICNCCR